MKDKTCMVTGANSGIGFEISKELLRKGSNVAMVCRNRDKGSVARSQIAKETGNESVELIIADLASLESVKTLAQTFAKSHAKLHVLVNNAGLILGKRTQTVDGLEETFEVNYLSHFLLTNLLLDTMKSSAPSRIVNVTSDAHYDGHIDFDDLQEEKRYGAMRSYCQSKLAQVLFTHELAERLKGTDVTVNCVHPGAVRTHWGDEAGALGVGIRIARPFMISPEKGAETPLYVAISPDVEGVSGKFFSSKKEKESSQESYNKEVAAKLWDVSMKLAGLQR
jgi:NAD(P)-dependent dehydrogenase (short-subunit alcohol dehydrogenase family)